jgi:transcriptional regulator with XRE-family HTH domain
MAILRARTAAGLTQEQLAAKMGTDRANIARLEQGRSGFHAHARARRERPRRYVPATDIAPPHPISGTLMAHR